MMSRGKVYIFDSRVKITGYNRKMYCLYGIIVDDNRSFSSPVMLINNPRGDPTSVRPFDEIYKKIEGGSVIIIDARDLRVLDVRDNIFITEIRSYGEASEGDIASMVDIATRTHDLVVSMDHSYMDMIYHSSSFDYSVTVITIKVGREWRKYKFLGNFDSPLSIRTSVYSKIGSQLAAIMYRARNLRDREAEEYARRIVETPMPIIVVPSARGGVRTLPRFEERGDAMWFYAKHLEPIITELYNASKNLSKELRDDIDVLFEMYQKYMGSQLKVKWIEDQMMGRATP
jgi:hypothetical protein